jgi:hypothetical protein
MVFELFFADGLSAGPSAKRGVFIFFLQNLCREPEAGRRHKQISNFFLKNMCRAPLEKAVDKVVHNHMQQPHATAHNSLEMDRSVWAFLPNHEMKSCRCGPAPCEIRVSISCGSGNLDAVQNSRMNSCLHG